MEEVLEEINSDAQPSFSITPRYIMADRSLHRT